MWNATGDNEMYQFCDRTGFGLGGGIHGGRFALYLGNDLWRGSSMTTECFNNECLSGGTDFECVDLEVWGFEWRKITTPKINILNLFNKSKLEINYIYLIKN